MLTTPSPGWIDPVLVVVVVALILWAAILLSRAPVRGDRAVGVASPAERLSALEARLAGLPQHSDLRDLGSRMSGVEQQVGVLAERVESQGESCERIERAVERLTDIHMREGK